jgi:predicted HTH domain antitoxin
MEVVTVRIGEKDFKDLKEIEKDEKTERAEVMRKLLASAIKKWKIEKALGLLKKRRVTIRRAAKIAEVSYVEMFDLATEEDIDIGYSLKELEKDLEM